MLPMPGRSPRRHLAALALGGAASLAGCGSGGGDGACGPVTREALDPAYLVHVVGTEEGLEYTSDPPTSGPHRQAPPVDGALEEPIPRPVQVGILERGDVLIQYGPEIGEAERSELEGLADDGVVVAPSADLPDPIVATAWVHKRTCESVDVEALESFVEERRGKGPE